MDKIIRKYNKDTICCIIGFEDSHNYLETAKSVYYKVKELIKKGVRKFVIGLYVQQFTCTEILRRLREEFCDIKLYCVMDKDQHKVKNKMGFSALDHLRDFNHIFIDAKQEKQEMVYMINTSDIVVFYSSQETLKDFEEKYIKFTDKKENYNCWKVKLALE